MCSSFLTAVMRSFLKRIFFQELYGLEGQNVLWEKKVETKKRRAAEHRPPLLCGLPCLIDLDF